MVSQNSPFRPEAIMPDPAISVLMPVYNALPFLRAAVESILGQDFGAFEFLIIDDRSNDGSFAVLEEYARRDPRIRLSRHEHNTGHTRALNEGLGVARGEFLARMDADDMAMPRRFGLQVKFLRDHPDHVGVGARILLVDEQNMPLCEMCEELTHEEIDAANLRAGGAAINHPSAMVRTASLRAIGGYREETFPAEDLDLWLRLAETGRLANLPQVLTRYRVHSKSISHSRAVHQRAKWRQVSVEARKRRGYPQDQLEPPPIPVTGDTGLSIGDDHIRWAWVALMHGHVSTARKHALAGIRRKPLSWQSWRLACCALRGH
jgi:glycosyltransferase involved in cell wall biosynthesis